MQIRKWKAVSVCECDMILQQNVGNHKYKK